MVKSSNSQIKDPQTLVPHRVGGFDFQEQEVKYLNQICTDRYSTADHASSSSCGPVYLRARAYRGVFFCGARGRCKYAAVGGGARRECERTCGCRGEGALGRRARPPGPLTGVRARWTGLWTPTRCVDGPSAPEQLLHGSRMCAHTPFAHPLLPPRNHIALLRHRKNPPIRARETEGPQGGSTHDGT